MAKQKLVEVLRTNLLKSKKLRKEALDNNNLLLSKKSVKTFQVERLKITHFDFLEADNTKEATHFFLRELYGVKDMTQRDSDLEKFLPVIERAFPLNTLDVITQAIILDALTEDLDTRMAKELGSIFTEEDYIEAFRTVGSEKERKKQLEIVNYLGSSLCSLVKIQFLATTLSMMKIPARIAGVNTLHEFLYSGFHTFREMDGAKEFVEHLIQREGQIIDNIFNNKEDCFKIEY